MMVSLSYRLKWLTCFLSLSCLLSCEKVEPVSEIESLISECSQYECQYIFRLTDFGANSYTGKSQGMDIFDDRYIFQAGTHDNIINILDIDTFSCLGSIAFFPPDGESSHMNNINCGEKYDNSDLYPLLYVSQTIDSHSCYVIRLANDLSSYELVQTIKYKGNKHHIRSNYDWFIDSRNGHIYTYGKQNGIIENREILKFPLPPIESSIVIFDDQDVADSFMLYNMSVYQGSKIIGDLLFAPVGYGNASYPGYLKVVDLTEKRVIFELALECGEPESIGSYKDGAIICGGGGNPKYYYIHL